MRSIRSISAMVAFYSSGEYHPPSSLRTQGPIPPLPAVCGRYRLRAAQKRESAASPSAAVRNRALGRDDDELFSSRHVDTSGRSRGESAVTIAQPDNSQTNPPRRHGLPRHGLRVVLADCRADGDAAGLCRRARSAHRRGLLLDLVEGERALLPRSSARHRLADPVRHRDLRRHQSRRAVRRHRRDAGHAIAARRHRPARDARCARRHLRGAVAGSGAVLRAVDGEGRARHRDDPLCGRDAVVAGAAARERQSALVARRGPFRRPRDAVEIHRDHAAAGGRGVHAGAGLAAALAAQPVAVAGGADCGGRVLCRC